MLVVCVKRMEWFVLKRQAESERLRYPKVY